ncbi:MAG: efflux RND transporter periplasmic adaptor subunit [Spartobacteria bacterium]|nr:efflux RND transporter periplasmic adaptor subunit [Spartobacteria bacterium]
MSKKIRMNRLKVRAVLRLVIGVGGLGFLIAWSGGCFKEKLEPACLIVETGIPVPEDAELYEVARMAIQPRIDVVGTVVSEELIHLSSRVSAYISEVHASAGERVSAGQVLVALDDRELREQYAMAQAQLQQAEAEYQRTKKLMEANAATDQALTATKSAYDAASARANQIDVMLSYTVIKSPIDGIVTDRRVEVGDLASPGQVLLSVYDPSRMRIEAPVPIRLINKFALAQDVDVQFDQIEEQVGGTVTEIVGEVDSLSRTQRVKVRLNDAAEVILPGTFGRVWVPGDAEEGVLIPRSAVYSVGQLQMVELVRNGRVVKRMVQTGAVYNGKVEILAGLQPGDTILVHPSRG